MRALLLILALAATGCRIIGSGSAEPPSDLDDARARWADLGLTSYDMDLDRICFCISAGQHTVVVRSDTVAMVVPGDSFWPADTASWRWFPTVEGLFDLIAEAETEAASLTVSYSADGWPERVDIDWIAEAVDDEISYRVHDVSDRDLVEPAVLAIGQSTQVDDWLILFDAVEADSRCPRSVTCFWEGQVVVLVTARQGTAAAKQLRLVNGGFLEGDSDSAQAPGLSVHLVAVTPYPADETPIPSSSYRIWLAISQPN